MFAAESTNISHKLRDVKPTFAVSTRACVCKCVNAPALNMMNETGSSCSGGGHTSTLACETDSHPQCCQSTKTVCDPDASAEQVASHLFAVSRQAWTHRRVSTNMLKMTNVELQLTPGVLFVAQQFLNFQNKSVE